jgi:hypothetical protein
MVGHYRRRRSAAAFWCERIALLCVPYFAIAVVLHRTDRVTSPQAVWLIGFGLVMLLASLTLGVRAIAELWNSGNRGGKAAARGMLLTLAMLAPFCWYGYLAMKHPALSDVSTNPYDPPPLFAAASFHDRLGIRGANRPTLYEPAYGDLIVSTYPRIGPRRYNAGAERIFDAVKFLIEDRGWDILAMRQETAAVPPASADAALIGAEVSEPRAPAERQGTGVGEMRIEAVSSSLIFGFRSDLVVAITPEEETTLVDMRSASRWGKHDFGKNAELIEKFLRDLDKALLGIGGEG